MSDENTPGDNPPETTPDTSPTPRVTAAEKDWPRWAPAYLEALRRRPSVSHAAERANVDRRTVQRFRQKDESFAVAEHEAREAALDLLESVIYARATSGLPVKRTVRKTLANGDVEVTEYEESHVSDTLAMFYLKRWRPEYREGYRIEHSGSVDMKINPEEVDRDIARILEDLGAGS